MIFDLYAFALNSAVNFAHNLIDSCFFLRQLGGRRGRQIPTRIRSLLLLFLWERGDDIVRRGEESNVAPPPVDVGDLYADDGDNGPRRKRTI